MSSVWTFTSLVGNCHYLQVIDSDLLLHPVVKALFSWKWTRYIASFFFINLTIYLVYLGFLTGFALQVPNPQHDICKIYQSTFCSLSLNIITMQVREMAATTPLTLDAVSYKWNAGVVPVKVLHKKYHIIIH